MFTAIGELIVILLFSITWHELAHALTATYLGDDTPRREGHMSLNPFAHMDQYGIMLLFLSVFITQGNGGFAYGFTPVNERNLRPNQKVGGGIVAVVGPVSNLLLAALLAIALRIISPDLSAAEWYHFLVRALFLNVFLAVLNILPLPPLDGWRVLSTFLTPSTLYSMRNFMMYGPIILFGLFFLESYIHFFATVIYPLVDAIVQLLAPDLPFSMG